MKKRKLIDIPEVIILRCIDVFLEDVGILPFSVDLVFKPKLMILFCYSLDFLIS